jgi:hypothetical protein
MRRDWLAFRCRCGWTVRLPAAWAPYRRSPALRCYACHGRLRPVLPRRRRLPRQVSSRGAVDTGSIKTKVTL